MSNSDLGVKWPAFGEYHCKICNRKWASSKAWRFYGQKCTTCDVTVQAMNLRQLFRYYCRDCKKLWKYKWEDNGVACKDCGENVKAFRTHTEYKKAEAEYILPDRLSRAAPDQPIDAEKPNSDLCEKYTKSGVNCASGRPVINSSAPISRPQASSSVKVKNKAVNSQTARDINQLERFCGVKNLSDFPPPPPPPSVNPWNRKASPPKLTPKRQSSAAISLPAWPKPAEMTSQVPERRAESSAVNVPATETKTVKNVPLANGIHNHRRESCNISTTKPTNPTWYNMNGSISSINGRANGIARRPGSVMNGTCNYNFPRQNRNEYADENSWNLWNCNIQ